MSKRPQFLKTSSQIIWTFIRWIYCNSNGYQENANFDGRKYEFCCNHDRLKYNHHHHHHHRHHRHHHHHHRHCLLPGCILKGHHRQQKRLSLPYDPWRTLKKAKNVESSQKVNSSDIQTQTQMDRFQNVNSWVFPTQRACAMAKPRIHPNQSEKVTIVYGRQTGVYTCFLFFLVKLRGKVKRKSI